MSMRLSGFFWIGGACKAGQEMLSESKWSDMFPESLCKKPLDMLEILAL